MKSWRWSEVGAITQPARASRKSRSTGSCLRTRRRRSTASRGRSPPPPPRSPRGASLARRAAPPPIPPRSRRAPFPTMRATALTAHAHRGEPRAEFGRSRSFVPLCSKEPGLEMGRGGGDRRAADAVRHRGRADIEPGSATWSIAAAPSPSGVRRSPVAIATFAKSTGDESLPRSPSPWNGPATRTPAAERFTKYRVDSSGDAAPGRSPLDT